MRCRRPGIDFTASGSICPEPMNEPRAGDLKLERPSRHAQASRLSSLNSSSNNRLLISLAGLVVLLVVLFWRGPRHQIAEEQQAEGTVDGVAASSSQASAQSSATSGTWSSTPVIPQVSPL